MTTEERLANVERELGRVKRRSRWLLAALGLAVAVVGLAWALTETTPPAHAQIQGAVRPIDLEVVFSPILAGRGPGPGATMFVLWDDGTVVTWDILGNRFMNKYDITPKGR